jgi:tripartite ATP-independent transporter DctM subunit
VAILFAVSAGVSIGGLFAAGVIPAFLILIVLLVFTAYRLRLEPDIRLPKATWRHRLRATRRSLLPLLTPVIILGGILGGFFTPTEAAAVAAAYMLFLGVISGNATFRKLYSVTQRAFVTSASIMFVVAGAGLFAWMLTRERIPSKIVSVLPEIIGHPIAFLLLLNIVLLALGMIIEPASAIIITAPVILPVALELGIDPLHLGVVVIFNLIIGLITPPVGIIIYVLSSVTDLTPLEVTKAILPWLVPLGIALLLLTLVPGISLWLPRQLGF